MKEGFLEADRTWWQLPKLEEFEGKFEDFLLDLVVVG